MPVDGPPRVLYEPSRGTMTPGASLNAAGTHMGFVQEAPDRAPEAFVMAVAGNAVPVQVSKANESIPLPAMGKTEVIRWKSKDGLEVEGVLTYPTNYEKGKKYPLILNIHGGPTGVFVESFIGRLTVYPIAAFSEHGYAVLRPNPRGSSGYGKTFRLRQLRRLGAVVITKTIRPVCGQSDRDGRRRSRPPGHHGLELRRLHDQLDHHPDTALQGRGHRRGRHQPVEFPPARPTSRALSPITSRANRGRTSRAG